MLQGTTGYDITFVGHLSKDINIFSSGKKEVIPGGGVYYGAFTAKSLGCKCVVITKVAEEDRILFKGLEDFGIHVIWNKSASTTSIENVYPSTNPDERMSRMISKAESFKMEDLNILSKLVHVTPLWYGEFLEDLLVELKKIDVILSTDAQGFLRNVKDNGEMYYRVPSNFEDVLKHVDVFKLDIKEGKFLTGLEDPEEILKTVERMGPSEIVLTQNSGVFVRRNGQNFFAEFGKYSIKGRTGRGDTCIAAYLCLRNKENDYEKLTKKVAEIVTKKLQKAGPYTG